MKKECDFCGAENEDWMKICINCGNDLTDAKEVKEAHVEKTPAAIRTYNPNSTLILILIILSVVLLILLFAVVSKFS